MQLFFIFVAIVIFKSKQADVLIKGNFSILLAKDDWFYIRCINQGKEALWFYFCKIKK